MRNGIKLLLLFISLQLNAQTIQREEVLPVSKQWQVMQPSFHAGADQCPDTIAPIVAPFPMSMPQQPIIRRDTVTLHTPYPTASENRTLIQQTIDSLATKGGGVVTIEQGQWLVGRLELRSGINLHLNAGATLLFSGAVEDYLPVVFTRDEGIEVHSLGACIYANEAHDIALTGKGTIVGASTDSELYQSMKERKIFLPKTFSPINCQRILVEGVTMNQGIYWNIVPQYCQDVTIRGVTVSSYGHGRTDGIDIDSSTGVLVEYCTMDCQDDCYCLKAGRGEEGLRIGRPTTHVVVRNCIALRGAGGIALGSETAGGIHHVYCQDCLFQGTDQGILLKTRRPRGGRSDSIFVSNIFAQDLKHSVFKVDMLGAKQYVGDAALRFPIPQVTSLTPGFSHIYLSDIYTDGCEKFINVKGLPESPLADVTIDSANIRCQSAGSITDAKDFHLNNIQLNTDDPTLHFDYIP